MPPISYARHRFPPVVTRHAGWLYLQFTRSYRDVKDLPAERGPDVPDETVRRWFLKFGPATARRLGQGGAELRSTPPSAAPPTSASSGFPPHVARLQGGATAQWHAATPA